MRLADGTLSDLTAALNEAISELGNPVDNTDGTLSSATSQLNALLVWAESILSPADGTLASATEVYNNFAEDYMTVYDIRYRLQRSPTATNDGSGMIQHEVWAVYLPENSHTNEEWKAAPPVPARHKTINIPYSELQTVMDMPHGTSVQKQAKNKAYVDALKANLNTIAEPISGWSDADMADLLDKNDLSATEAQRADDYIVITLSQEYPVPFSA
jgi:hypothetical protein